MIKVLNILYLYMKNTAVTLQAKSEILCRVLSLRYGTR
jgi:accessory gene regulator protein AgrB